MGTLQELNMKLLLAALLVVLAFSQPSPPKWPTAFSSTIVITDNARPGPPQFSRWFYDASANVDRLDGLAFFKGELYFAELFFDRNTNTSYDVYYQEGSVVCFEHSINRTLPKPDFSQFKYVGVGYVQFQTCNLWVLETTNNSTFMQYFENSQTRYPVRFDITDEFTSETTSFGFMEFDEGAQDPEMFTVNPLVKSACNKV